MEQLELIEDGALRLLAWVEYLHSPLEDDDVEAARPQKERYGKHPQETAPPPEDTP